MEWISVKDRLPTIEGTNDFSIARVIVAYKHGVMEGRFTKWGKFYKDVFTGEIPEVTHWMPLPEPPNE